MPDLASSRASWSLSRRAVVLSVAILLLAGAGHRILLARIAHTLGKNTLPVQPLASLPTQFGMWHGKDIPLDQHVRRIAGDDDWLNRTYTHTQTHRTIHLYIGYVGRSRTWMSHRPEVCYQAQGYRQVARRPLTVKTTESGSPPCFYYEFESPQPAAPRELVLSTYVINGQFVDDITAGTAVTSRTTPIFGRQIAYLARIQLSTPASGDSDKDLKLLTSFASQVIGPVAGMMPSVMRKTEETE